MTPKYVTVSESVVLDRNTVEGLVETLKEVFSAKVKPVRVVYRKNEPLIVDKRIRQEIANTEGLLSAYQVVRQHSEIEIVEEHDNPLRQVTEAAQQLSNAGFNILFLVCANRFSVYQWFDKTLRPDKMLNIQLIEDPDCNDDCFFLCGSKSGESIRDIEYSILCRM